MQSDQSTEKKSKQITENRCIRNDFSIKFRIIRNIKEFSWILNNNADVADTKSFNDWLLFIGLLAFDKIAVH